VTSQSDKHDRFVEYLEDLVNKRDRAALAMLRRGLGRPPGTAVEMYRCMGPFVSEGVEQWHEASYFLVASLFAHWHHRSSTLGEEPPRNMGASFAQLRAGAESDSVEKRFIALLKSHRDDLPVHLRQAIGLLRSHDVPVNWRQLLRDLDAWNHEDRRVQRNWARAFWGTRKQEKKSAPASGEEPSHQGGES
jgi:CRISPR type I-E-associated protein CasB/Cse2